MTDGMTVRLHRHLPDQAQVVGFSYGLGEEQASYLLSEARVEGLALEAVEAAELSAVLNSGEFQARCGGSLRWLQGLDLLGELQLEVGVWVCGCVGVVEGRSCRGAAICYAVPCCAVQFCSAMPRRTMPPPERLLACVPAADFGGVRV